MVRVTILYLVQLCLFYGTNHERAKLPQYVFRVDACPCPNNISKWQDASKRLHCLHDLNSTDTGNAYHCLPSSYLNETVEFCGKGISVPPGHCPFYDYKVNADDIPDLYACNAFMSGCPTQSFSSKDVYKFLSCLKINRKNGCYEEESDCPKTSVIPVPTKIANDVKTTINSELSTIPTDSSPDIQKTDDKAMYIYVSISVIGTTCLIIGLIVSLKDRYKYKCLYQQMKMEIERKEFTTPNNTRRKGSHYIQMEDTGVDSTVNSPNLVSEEELERLMPENPTVHSPKLVSEEELERVMPENPTVNSINQVSEGIKKPNKCTSEFKEFDNFLELIGSCITDETWQSMRAILLGILDHKWIAKLNITRMLFELSKLFNLQYNVPFLESIFEECGELHLVEQCQKFTAENKLQFIEFQTNFMPCCGNEQLIFMMKKTSKESVTDQVNNLRNLIGKTIQVHPGRILLTALDLQTETIAVTFMMRDKHVDSLLDHVKTDDGQIDMCHIGVKQIIQDKNVFKIDKAVNGSRYIQVHLHSEGKSDNDYQKVSSCILKRTGLSMEGNTIYKRTVPFKLKDNDDGGESSSERTFIDKNRDSLLDNLEPTNICNTEIALLFEKEDMTKIKSTVGRRKRAELFLEMSLMLPEESFKKVCSSYLEKHVSLSKDVTNNEELGSLRKLIQKNHDALLDEVDSDFIETTIFHMKYVPEKDKTLWSDRSKGRKENAKIFLNFAMQKDVMALKKTIDEKKLELTE